uniref:L-Fucosyltransferase n=1 Tax=Syphacia muris TaxID=451379 RepID=A0A0N5AN99_9BILA
MIYYITARRRGLATALIAVTFLLLWTITLLFDTSIRYNYKTESGKITGISHGRRFSLFVDDVIFDQPWSIDNVTSINDVNYFLTNTQNRYIISDFTYSPGSLGNLMFQYATLKSLALNYTAELLVPINCKLRRAFSLNVTFISEDVFDKLFKLFKTNRTNFQICCKYYPPSTYQIFNTPGHHIEFLTGYFQSFRYFHPQYETVIRNEFKFLPEIQTKAKNLINTAKNLKLIPNNSAKFNHMSRSNRTNISYETNITYVGLHVRMGVDVTLNIKNVAHGHTTATKEYFMHAMDYFRNKYGNVLFIIASDNPNWVRREIKPQAHVLFVEVMNASSGEIYVLKTHQREIDLATLTLCNATILSTGTFSWWAGYLANGEAIYYQNWPLKDSVLDFMVQKSDFFMPTWISME